MNRSALRSLSSSPESAFDAPRVERLLLLAERSIRLIDRLTPLNSVSERERLSSVFERGGASLPRFQYAAAPDLSPLRRQLGELARTLEGRGIVETLLADRARELGDEASLIAALGSSDFRRLAEIRFPVAFCPSNDALCEKWLAEPPTPVPTELTSSEDLSSPKSLVSRLNFLIAQRRLEIRVELRRELSSVAAAGDGFVAVRPGVRLATEEAERIALHELEAHVLPRLRARKERAVVFRVGCRGSGEHEEGRALLIEERCGLLTRARRFELAARHQAAKMVRADAEFAELVSNLGRYGLTVKHAVEIATRVVRGGGLAREIVYLPAYLEVRASFVERPELERYFERGRVSLKAARTLLDERVSAVGRRVRSSPPLDSKR